MKNYLNSTLTGLRLFPFFLIYLIATWLYVVALSSFATVSSELTQQEVLARTTNMLLYIFIYLVVMLFIQYFFTKLYIENIEYSGERLVCRCTFGGYLRIVLPGLLLSILTIGIYAFWLEARILRFFVNNTNYRGKSFQFNGLGSTLFGITIVAYLLPLILVAIIASFLPPQTGGLFYFLLLLPIASFYVYLLYRWIIDITINGITVRLKANHIINGAGYILGQLLLSIITLGFYFPAASIRIYHLFIRHSELIQADGTPAPVRIGYTPCISKDYLYFLIQGILTILTLGIYGSWAVANIYRRILTRTYIEEELNSTNPETPAIEGIQA